MNAEMGKSDDVGELAKALAKAQAAMGRALKDSKNPHFGSKYADLAAVQDVARGIHEYGLSYTQLPVSSDGQVGVRTMLMHESGQYVWSELLLPLGRGGGPQGAGSALTYARRYSLAAVLGIAQEDDDGNAAQDAHRRPPQRSPKDDLRAAMKAAGLDAAWMAKELGRKVSSSAPLTDDEARKLLGVLEAL